MNTIIHTTLKQIMIYNLKKKKKYLRILKLEKSLSWLQEQHTRMLADLHNEIESLKIKNRGRKINFHLNF